MTVLITGGGGYVGTVLVRYLLQYTTHSLIVLDRFTWGAQPLLYVIPASAAQRVEILRGDVRNIADVARAMDWADVVIHLAAVVGFPACDQTPDDAETTNVAGTDVVCQHLQGRKILFASTGSVYGKVGGICTEETAVNPLTRYGQTKLRAEQLVVASGGLAFRIASLHGLSPRTRWDILPHAFARWGVQGQIALFDPTARRTLLHVEDVARAFVWGLEHYQPGVYNLGHEDGNRTKREIAELVQSLTGCELAAMDGHDPDERDYFVSYEKIRRAGWVPTTTFGVESMAPVVSAARVWGS